MLRQLTISIFLIILVGCAGTEKLRGEFRYGMDDATEGQQVLFPSPPDVPRLAYAGELVGERNFVVEPTEKSLGQKLLDILTGVSDAKTELQLTRPQSVVTDGLGRVYVSDAGLAAIFIFDPVEGGIRLLRRAQQSRDFLSPSGLAIGPDGSLFVADSEAGYVARIDRAGTPLSTIGDGVLGRPTGIAFDSVRQRLYVSDTAASDIKVFDLNGRLLMTFGKPGLAMGDFNRPTHLAIWRNEIYVADTLNARIQVLDIDNGNPIRSIGSRGNYVGQLSMPKGVAVDSDGNVYVVESLNDHLLIFNHSGQFLLPVGGTGYSPGRFYLPAGIWIDAKNRIYLADMYNGRIATYLYLGGEAESNE